MSQTKQRETHLKRKQDGVLVGPQANSGRSLLDGLQSILDL